jgi:putative ABC transport system substrate-binding protein
MERGVAASHEFSVARLCTLRLTSSTGSKGPTRSYIGSRPRTEADPKAGPDLVDQYRRAAAYVDRILKGEKPANVPVQTPTK